jgi:hypothetical protein
MNGHPEWRVKVMVIKDDGSKAVVEGSVFAQRFEVNLAGALLFYDTPATAQYPEPIQSYAPGAWLSVCQAPPNN